MPRESRLEEALLRRAERIQSLRESCSQIFSLGRKITLEIGCGKGHYLSAYAQANPEELCVGIDLISERRRDSRRRAERREARNAHFFKAEAFEFLEAMPRDLKLEKIFIFFPDPWPKKRHHKRRLIQEKFLNDIRKFTSVGTKLYFRTDYAEYFEWALDAIKANPNWELLNDNTLPFEEVSQFQRILPNFSTLVAAAK